MGLMDPQTAREAWERGYEDAQRYHEHGNPVTWRMLTGSDPTEAGYAERVFGPLARDWQAGFTAAGTVEACGCEHVSHMEDDRREGHLYGGVPAGERRAQHVGRVCDPCAETHMADYLIPRGEKR